MSLPISHFAIKLCQTPIRFYRAFISPLFGSCCRFSPSCSAYALEALEKHGIARGLYLTTRRLCRCHPYYSGAWHDPVPESFAKQHVIGYNRPEQHCNHAPERASNDIAGKVTPQ